jgi:hypothetical protein
MPTSRWAVLRTLGPALSHAPQRMRHRAACAWVAAVLCWWPAASSAQNGLFSGSTEQYHGPELGAAMHVGLGGPFGLIASTLQIAPFGALVFEGGAAQRMDDTPRWAVATRVRVWRHRQHALGAAIGLTTHRDYVSFRLDCEVFPERACENRARDVWKLPTGASYELRAAINITLQAYAGLSIPVAYGRCDKLDDGERVGSCRPRIVPYLGAAIGWVFRPLSARSSSGARP